MLELSNLTAQTIQPGQAVTFDKVLLHTGCGECFQSASPKSAKLRGKGVYKLEFSGNVTSTAAATTVQLAIAIGGNALPQTAMNATPAAAGTLVNVGTGTYWDNCCCDMDRVSVVNSGTTPIVLAPNSSFRIARRA